MVTLILPAHSMSATSGPALVRNWQVLRWLMLSYTDHNIIHFDYVFNMNSCGCCSQIDAGHNICQT